MIEPDNLKNTGAMNIFIAYLAHSPEDTAIGLGATEDSAISALIKAYPWAIVQPIDVTSCALGSGLPSLEAAPCQNFPMTTRRA